MIPDFPILKPISQDDIKYIQAALVASNPEICELSISNLIIWQEFDRPQITQINGNLCILINPLNESPYFLQPIGSQKLLATIEDCMQYTGKISRASENFTHQLPKGKYSLTCLRGHFDYIYLKDDLSELKGKKYDGKRNQINKFKKIFPAYKFVKLKPEILNEALALFDQWFKIREESRYFPKMAYAAQQNALKKAFQYFKELSLIGGAMYAGSALAGFIIGSTLNHDTVSVHFAYTQPDLPGISQVLLNEASMNIYNGYKYINLEQDLGIPGLRQAKLSYHPIKLVRKFEVRLL